MDRLTALPDELIFHLLSFLPPKTVVQTSILAKAWRFHWSRVLCFGLTNQVQVLPKTLNSFSGTTDHEFASWVSAAFARNVRNLVIGLNYQFTLPPCLFTSETLFYLRIFDCGSIPDGSYSRIVHRLDIPGGDITVYFPALKKLELDNVGCVSEYSLTHLLKGCPVLEELAIERLNEEDCILISETVTKLVIHIEDSEILLLGIPSLRYLYYRVHNSEIRNMHIRARSLVFLVEADIDVMSVTKYRVSWSVVYFVRELYNVKRLTLSTRQLKDTSTLFFSNWDDVKFHNLTDLNLRAGWRFITCFLENADNIRVLTIFHMVDHNTQYWTEPKQVPTCLVSHLEAVNLVDFGWSTQHEFDMVKYILKNAEVLKRMEIICTQHCELDWNGKFDVIKKLGMFEIGSRACELYINLD